MNEEKMYNCETGLKITIRKIMCIMKPMPDYAYSGINFHIFSFAIPCYRFYTNLILQNYNLYWLETLRTKGNFYKGFIVIIKDWLFIRNQISTLDYKLISCNNVQHVLLWIYTANSFF